MELMMTLRKKHISLLLVSDCDANDHIMIMNIITNNNWRTHNKEKQLLLCFPPFWGVQNKTKC